MLQIARRDVDMSTSPDSDTSKMRLSKPEPAPILAQASSKVPAPLRTKLTLALSLVAGYVDAYAFLKYSVYASFMSGNTTQTGLQAGQAQFTTAARDFLPIPLFVIGVFAGIILNDRRLRWRCGLVAGLLIISAAYPHLDTHNGWFIIVILSFAMGIVNTTVTHIGGQSVHLGFVTATLYSLAEHVALEAKGCCSASFTGTVGLPPLASQPFGGHLDRVLGWSLICQHRNALL